MTEIKISKELFLALSGTETPPTAADWQNVWTGKTSVPVKWLRFTAKLAEGSATEVEYSVKVERGTGLTEDMQAALESLLTHGLPPEDRQQEG